MNKAFTANINDQVTARGYLDENNQLIMLEPEGSGGGDFGIANLTIDIDTENGPSIDYAYISEGQTIPFFEPASIVGYDGTAYAGDFKIPLYKGASILRFYDTLNYDVEISGDINKNDQAPNMYIIHGDCSIRITKKV